jgi:hypothetical protein
VIAAGTLWAATCALGQAGADSAAGEWSILTNEASEAGAFIHALPSAGSYENLLEFTFQPINSALEESGGFSTVDPQKLSIYGSSPYWTQWYFERFNLTDTLFSGAAAIHVPYRFLGGVAIRFNEDARNDAAEGVTLRAGSQETRAGPLAGYSLTLPELGGIAPGGVAVVHAFSTTHATERTPPPPGERERFGRHQRFWVLDEEDTRLGHLRWAVELDQGSRRFLAFTPPDAAFRGVAREDFAIASAAVVIEPDSKAYRAYLLGEYRHRDHLFAELGYAPDETARYDGAALFAGIATDALALGATVKAFGIQHRDLTFSRDLIDPDGEAIEPWYPEGRYLTVGATLRYRSGRFYIDANDHLLSFDPSQTAWSNAITYALAPYGRADWSSSPTLESFGRNRFGAHDEIDLGPFLLAYDLFLEGSYALNRRFENGVAFLDPGLKAELRLPLADGGFSPFVAISKTPVPINGDLARFLDSSYLSSGKAISVSPHLVPADIDSAAIGLKANVAKWRISVEALARMYRGTYWIEAGGEANAFVLTNYPSALQQPFYAGLHAQIFRAEADRFLFDLSFSALTAVGYTAFGNGVTANDLGVLSYSTASSTSLVNGLAALDGDRAFITKGVFGFSPLEGLWILAAVRHKDGEPFAFYDYRVESGRVVITYHQNRGSPLSRKLIGSRTDFRVDTDLKIQYTITAADLRLTSAIAITNALDFGSERLERSSDIGRQSRAALELEIPRAMVLSVEAAY